MAYTNLTVDKLKDLLRARGIRGYSGKRKDELIAMLEQGGAPAVPVAHPPPHPHPALQHRELLHVIPAEIIDLRAKNPKEVTYSFVSPDGQRRVVSVPIAEDEYIDAYIPYGTRLGPEYRETGLEQKYGGSVPLFVREIFGNRTNAGSELANGSPTCFVAHC